jgi:hypothetical protein
MELPARTEVWVRLIGAITSDQATKIKCDPKIIDFDDLKELVKAKCQIELAAVDAFRLKVKKNARDYWESDEKVAAAGSLGARATTPLEVEVPAASGG